MHSFQTKHYLSRARQHPLFRSLSRDQFQQLANSARYHDMQAGDTLYLQDDCSDRFYLLLQGMVKIFRVTNDGRETVLSLGSAMDCIGEAEIFSDRPNHIANAAIAEDARLLSFSSEAYKALLKSSSASCYGVLMAVASRLHEQFNEIESLSKQSASDRVIGFILSQVKESDSRQESVEIRLPLTKRLIAARLSMQPETFSRVMAGFKRQGLIEVNGSQLNIHSLNQLRQMI